MSPSAPVCSPTFTISSGSASSIPVDSRAVVRLAPSRIRLVAPATARAIARLPIECGRHLQRVDERQASREQRRERARQLAGRVHPHQAAEVRQAQQRRVEGDARTLPPEPVHDGTPAIPRPSTIKSRFARSVVATASRIRVGSGSSAPSPS